jgi:protein-tyrosine phosphatase
MSSAPGKKVMGRDGWQYNRSMEDDLQYLRSDNKITMVVCLLNGSELTHIGISLKEYQEICKRLSIEFMHHPVVEMAGMLPEELLQLCRSLAAHLEDPSHHVLLHCRGGMGRTGTLAACMLLHGGEVKNGQDAIDHVRQHRSSRAVESRKQEDSIHAFFKCLPQLIARPHSD